MANWVHQRAAISGSSNTINANSKYIALRQVALDSTEECTVKDMSVRLHFQRAMATGCKIMLMVVPDDIATALTTADLTLANIQRTYEDFIWLEHTCYFGTSTSNGVASMNLDLKTGTSRSLGPYDKLLICIDMQDLENTQGAYLMGSTFDYFYLSKGSA